MELRQLATFRVVARTLSFTRAAEALDYAQSSVTAQVQALEEDFGVHLFERLGKRIALTEAGERLLTYADKLLGLADEARAVVPAGDEPRGKLVIGAPESLCAYRLPPVLSQMRVRFPRVQLVFRPYTCLETRRAILDGLLDVGLLLEEPIQAPGLIVESLVDEPLCLLTYPDHPLARQARVEASDLAGEPILVTEAGCSYRVLLERILADAGARVETTIEFGSVEAIKQCVMAGMGLTILPHVTVAAELEQGRLVAVSLHGHNLCIVTQLAWHKDKWLSPSLRAFLDLTREVLGARAATAER